MTKICWVLHLAFVFSYMLILPLCYLNELLYALRINVLCDLANEKLKSYPGYVRGIPEQGGNLQT